MGWLTSSAWQSKSEMIAHLCNGENFTPSDGPEKGQPWARTVAKCVRGNVLYTVHEFTRAHGGYKAGDRWIGVYLLGAERGFGWGYKDQDESMGPCEYGCPVAYFDMVPDPGGHATAWRAKCRAEAARKARKLTVGQTVKLIHACTFGGVPTEVDTVEILTVRPLRVKLPDGRVGRLPRRMIAAE